MAKKWLILLLVGAALLCGGLFPGAAWAADNFDDEGESQIYAIYAAGQQGGNKQPADKQDSDNEIYEPIPGDEQDNPGNKPAENEQKPTENPEEKPDNTTESKDETEKKDSAQNQLEQIEPEKPVQGTDFPALAESLDVLMWDAASQTNKKSRVTPVNLALRGAYLPSDVPAMAIEGRTLVPVRLISEQLEANVVWEQATNTVTISLDGKSIVLTIGSSTALVDGKPVQVPGDVSVSLVTYEGTARTMVPVRFVSESLAATVDYDAARHIVNITPPVKPEPVPEPDDDRDIWQNRPITPDGSYDDEPEEDAEPVPVPPPGIDENGNLLRRVVLDAGHGGTDPGTNGSGHDEKDINLAVTLKLQTELENAGFTVIMARSDDSYLGLVERAALTVEADAPVFVSIHCNSAANIPSANGIETYAAPDDADDAELAGFIQKELIAATKAKDRGVKTSPLVVLTHNAAPACLVEIGFMSNSEECAKIADSAYQQKLAEAVAAGVKAYFAAKAEQ